MQMQANTRGGKGAVDIDVRPLLHSMPTKGALPNDRCVGGCGTCCAPCGPITGNPPHFPQQAANNACTPTRARPHIHAALLQGHNAGAVAASSPAHPRCWAGTPGRGGVGVVMRSALVTEVHGVKASPRRRRLQPQREWWWWRAGKCGRARGNSARHETAATRPCRAGPIIS